MTSDPRFVRRSAPALVLAVALLAASAPASAQTGGWTSTDVGAVALAGSATESNGVWTISGDGSDIWGTADSFQFLHQPATPTGAMTVRVVDLQNTSPFAKAGLMLRAGVGAGDITVLFDVKPDGGLELMARGSAGNMGFVTGGSATLPVWLRLEWGQRINDDIGTEAWTSQDGLHWTRVGSTISPFSVRAQNCCEAGVAVTSHDPGQLTTAHVDHLTIDSFVEPWQSRDVGAVGVAGAAAETNGVWTVTGAGGDIWGPADAFQFLERGVLGTNQHVRVRVNDLANTSAFAKTGVMLRSTSDPDSPTVILDVKPDGGIEFMARTTWGGEMQFLDGLAAASPGLPVWLDLSWHDGGDGAPATAGASVSRDGVNWLTLSGAPSVPVAATFLAGIAVNSHDTSHATTAHLQALSLLPVGVVSDDIGSTGLAGNAAGDFRSCCPGLLVEGAGADIWGTADSLAFVHPIVNNTQSTFVSIDAANPFAKAGLMFRDGLDPGAPTVILDVKPDGGIEFMARRCAGCEMEFLGGGQLDPATVQLQLTGGAGGTFQAFAGSTGKALNFSVTVPMANPIRGYAVTSHDPTRIARARFVQTR